MIGEFKKVNCLAGVIICCCQDMERCWVCGHTRYPFGTKWGLFNLDATPKPTYYSAKKIITGH